MKDAYFTEEDCATNHDLNEIPKQSFDEIDLKRGIDCPGRSTVSILFLFTQNANNAVADIEAVADLSLEQMKQSLRNSRVDDNDLDFEIADILPLNGFNEINIEFDVEALATDPFVQNLRATTEADIVILLTNGNYGGFHGIKRGQFPNTAFQDAYCISQVNSATSRKTAAHEIVHALNGWHEDQGPAGINHGYRFRPGWWPTHRKATIVGRIGKWNGKHRILYYSNPDVSYSGHATGTNNQNDNVSHFETAGVLVANHFPNNTSSYQVSINGPWGACPCFSTEYTADIICGDPPFAIQWHTSTDGVNWQFRGSRESFFFVPPCNVQSLTSIRLSVTDANGNTEVRQKTVGATPAGYGCPRNNPWGKSEVKAFVSPNPINSSSNLHLEFEERGNGLLKIEILDSWGNSSSVKEINDISKTLLIPIHEINIQKTGVYYVNVYSDNILIKTLPVVFQK